jgi:outer membrane protein TolC
MITGPGALSIAMLLLSAPQAQPAAEPQAGASLTLEAALELAQQQSFRIDAGRESVEAARRDIGVSRADHFPTLDVVGGYSSFRGDVFVARFVNPQDPSQPNPEGGQTDVGPYDSTTSAALRLTQTRDAGGATSARVDASRAAHGMAGQDLRQMRLDLGYEVTRAYFDVLLSARQLTVAESALRRSEENLQTVQRGFAEGEALRVQVLGAESQLAADRHALSVAESDQRFAKRALNRLLAREPDSPIELQDSLEQPLRLLDEEASARMALDQNPLARKASFEIELAEAQLKGASAYRKPKLQVEAFVSYIDNQMLLEGTYFGANVNLSIPFIRDFAKGSSAVGKARAGLRARESQLRELRSALSLQAQNAARRVKEAQMAIEVAGEYLEYQEERYRVSQTAYQENLATFSEILESHTDLSQAQLQLYQAHYQAQLAAAELRRVTGSADPAAGSGGS